MIVLIDDNRIFKPVLMPKPENIIVLRNSADALKWLDSLDPNTTINQLWLDHDLGNVNGQLDSIMPVVKKLEELHSLGKMPNICEVIIHTSNVVGGRNIQQALSSFMKVQKVYAGDYLQLM